MLVRRRVVCYNTDIKESCRYGSTAFCPCDSGGIQTHNLLIRSQMLYSVELRNQSIIIGSLYMSSVIPAGFKPTTF